MRHLVSAAVLVAVLLCLSPSFAAELAGVTLPDTENANARELVLNGIALREKFFVDVYVAGLYLPEKSNAPEAILNNDESRVMVMRFLRDVDAQAINEAWIEGLEANVENAAPELRKKFDELAGMMTDMKEGQEMRFIYTNAVGTDVMVAGQVTGTIPGKDFADAILSTWIGPKPGPGASFKRQILGEK
ncbi:chalcone isomerase family protein [Pseudodesulfovibrio thermohalotolerans]|uniref:chalcone isomerase family protein n=1 Tax=Pseudodesulfovibrio thermohalotolerans TaxID=2880651 RepID=UPI0022B9F236|nr:chalcone isomerase family protein [Pseudodesulfovibrio thermohalotolerans]WFS64136.1 chalcone isomerase family protein [Pseudodesulfovibrio thermohalotolerans]